MQLQDIEIFIVTKIKSYALHQLLNMLRKMVVANYEITVPLTVSNVARLLCSAAESPSGFRGSAQVEVMVSQ